MSYLFQATLLVSVLVCVMLSEAFWSWSSVHNSGSLIREKGSNNFLHMLMAGACVFLIYAVMDCYIPDYLMMVPGMSYGIA